MELLENELFDYLTMCEKWLKFNWIVSDTQQYLEPFKFDSR